MTLYSSRAAVVKTPGLASDTVNGHAKNRFFLKLFFYGRFSWQFFIIFKFVFGQSFKQARSPTFSFAKIIPTPGYV